MMHIRTLAIVAVAVLFALAWQGDACGAAFRTYVGETVDVGHGTATSWMTTDTRGKPLSIGVDVSESAMQDLPLIDTEYVIAFPRQASRTQFNHFALDWLPHGHVPAGIYDVPHFDMHFYMIGPAERNRITATPEDMPRMEKRPAARYIPQGYAAFPGGIPHMGAHWYYEGTPEMHGRPFTTTFLYGFYNGRMVFIEPMMTRSYLLTRPNFRQTVRLPAAYQRSGYYPTRYAVKYDPAKRHYIIALQGLTYRRAG